MINEGKGALQASATNNVKNKRVNRNRRVARFSSQDIRDSQLAPRILYISIEAMDEAW
jgi:hypothetical protein